MIPVGLGGKGVRQTRDLKSVLQKAAIGGAGVVVGASLAGVALSGSNSKGADRKLIPSHVSSCKYSPPPRPPPPSLAGKAKKEKVD